MVGLGVVETVFVLRLHLSVFAFMCFAPPVLRMSAGMFSVYSGSCVVHITATASSPWSKLNPPSALLLLSQLTSMPFSQAQRTSEVFPFFPEATCHPVSPRPMGLVPTPSPRHLWASAIMPGVCLEAAAYIVFIQI